MTVKRRLSKVQETAIMALVAQRDRLQADLGSTNAAIEEQAELYRGKFELPEGQYRFRGSVDGIDLEKVPDPPVEAKETQPKNDEAASPKKK